ncbi:putative nagB/RpiA transferase, initiation factor 2B-like protein [Dioscorea sansibarensis]
MSWITVLNTCSSVDLTDGPDISKAPGRKGLNHFDDWTDEENLQPLNLVYEATPLDNISLIITEYGLLPPTSVPGILPPTSVPVIVREYCRY